MFFTDILEIWSEVPKSFSYIAAFDQHWEHLLGFFSFSCIPHTRHLFTFQSLVGLCHYSDTNE